MKVTYTHHMQIQPTSADQKVNRKVRTLIWDIETSPNIVLAFSAGFGLNINHDSIVFERKIICIAYKWVGENKVTVLRWDKNQDDRAMLKEFVKVANTADQLVAHYGNHFDLPWFRTRILYHRLPPIPIYKTVDTKALASKYFYFNSNKLDYISDYLGHGKKLRTEFSLWKKILMDKCDRSLNYMCKYCGVDVRRLEKVYLDFVSFVPTKIHAGVYGGLDKWTCPRTGSTNVKKSKTMITAHGVVQHQMQNLDTGAYFTISNLAYEQYKKAKASKVQKVRIPSDQRKR